MLNHRYLRIDPTSLERKMLLVGMILAYEYKHGERSKGDFLWSILTIPQSLQASILNRI